MIQNTVRLDLQNINHICISWKCIFFYSNSAVPIPCFHCCWLAYLACTKPPTGTFNNSLVYFALVYFATEFSELLNLCYLSMWWI